MKKIILCADDYGQNDSINDAILDLLAKQRLSAVSCMVKSSGWPQAAKLLQPFIGKTAIGLHFTLTPKSYSLKRLIVLANLRFVNKSKIEQEFTKQLDNFVKHLGEEPDFIDGHQHVHQLPIISDVIFKVYQQRLTEKKPYIRYVNAKLSIKALIIKAVSDFNFRKKLQKFNIPYNKSFAGIYDFKQDYKNLFPKILATAQDGELIMCHPGLKDNNDDPIAAARFKEYQYLASEQFMTDLRRFKAFTI